MDPQQQQQAANLMAGMGMGAVLFIFVFFLAVAVFFVYLVWRIFTKAGLAGPLALLWLVPGIGWIIALCILAFSDWKVVPVHSGYGNLPPSYPPPAYPPATAYPPANPPQL